MGIPIKVTNIIYKQITTNPPVMNAMLPQFRNLPPIITNMVVHK